MPIIGLTLAAVAQMCARDVAPRTTLAVEAVESGGFAWAIGDNDTGVAYVPGLRKDAPRTKAQAVALAESLLDRGDGIGIGLMQVDSGNFPAWMRQKLPPGSAREQRRAFLWTMFDPCVNVARGTDILLGSYFGRQREVNPSAPRSVACKLTIRKYPDGRWYCRSGGAVDLYGPGELALSHAFQMYNSGHANGAPAYAHKVWNAGIELARSGW